MITIKEIKSELLKLLKTYSYKNKKVILASGKESDFFIDCKQTILTARGLWLASSLFYDIIKSLPNKPNAIAGVELGGCPLASGVSLYSYANGGVSDPILDAIYVRKTIKDHGSKRELEGNDVVECGSDVVLIEDVITTGNSSLVAVDKLIKNNYKVNYILALVDRQEGGKENILKQDLELISLFNKSDFICKN